MTLFDRTAVLPKDRILVSIDPPDRGVAIGLALRWVESRASITH